MTARDIRSTPYYSEAEEFFTSIYAPGTEAIVDVGDMALSPDHRHLAFTGHWVPTLDGGSRTRVCLLELHTGAFSILRNTPGSQRLPRWSPCGRRASFLLNHDQVRDPQIYIGEQFATAERASLGSLAGTVETYEWSPDGRQMLLVVAGSAADVPCIAGAKALHDDRGGGIAWAPSIESSDTTDARRTLVIYDVATGVAYPLERGAATVWEASWAGPDRLVALSSEDPTESGWYRSSIVSIDPATKRTRTLYVPSFQVGHIVASPTGRFLAFVESLCSDRGKVCGELHLLDLAGDRQRIVDTGGVDVTSVRWMGDRKLLYAGCLNLSTVVAEYDLDRSTSRSLWSRSDLTSGLHYPHAEPIGDDAFVLAVESYRCPPAIMHVQNHQERILFRTGAAGLESATASMGAIRGIDWRAPDEMEIHGWLIEPETAAPWPLVVDVHGGPVSSHRNRWLGRLRATALLARRGCAVLFPNPRGSSGRGQEFARSVLRDMGGRDAQDLIAGTEALVSRRIADPRRLGITGVSYGGFMATWLITQDPRFAASVAISPVTNWLSLIWSSHIAEFGSIFFGKDASSDPMAYLARSPALHAATCRTPVLLIAGALDRASPPGQAIEFYRTASRAGCNAEVAVYPAAGHGVRELPSVIDTAARVVEWFDRWLQLPRRSAT